MEATIESDEEENLDELLDEFCFIIDDGGKKIEDDIQLLFEELYQDTVKIARHKTKS